MINNITNKNINNKTNIIMGYNKYILNIDYTLI